jgi:hypothetical protein
MNLKEQMEDMVCKQSVRVAAQQMQQLLKKFN